MASSERVYEDFVPPHQMERELATHTLTVNLSAQGYKKEHIRVVQSHRRLIVRGERPVVDGDDTRWSRFRLELRVPDECDGHAMHARFDNNGVRVTMPVAPQKPDTVVDSVTGQQQQQDLSSPTPKPPDATAGDDVQDDGGSGDLAAARRGQEQEEDNKHEMPRKQEARQRVVGSAKDAAGGGSNGSDDDTGGLGEVMTAASPSARQGYGFLRNRNMTVLGVVLALISLGIYVRYSLRSLGIYGHTGCGTIPGHSDE